MRYRQEILIPCDVCGQLLAVQGEFETSLREKWPQGLKPRLVKLYPAVSMKTVRMPNGGVFPGYADDNRVRVFKGKHGGARAYVLCSSSGCGACHYDDTSLTTAFENGGIDAVEFD